MRVRIAIVRHSLQHGEPCIRIHRGPAGRTPLSSDLADPRSRLGPLAASVAVHAAILGLLLLAPRLTVPEQRVYDQVIGPHRPQLVWYSFRRKLPPISPTQRQTQPFRVVEFRYAHQTIISNPPQGERGWQTIHHPSPPAQHQPRVTSPSILAFRSPLITPPKPSPPMAGPGPAPPNARAASLPEPHRAAGQRPSGSLPLITESTPKILKTPKRKFVPPLSGTGDVNSTRIPPVMDAPTTDIASLPSPDVAIAIVSPNPAAKLNGPLPEAPLDARFSAGPMSEESRGSLDSVSSPSLLIPSLLVRDSSSQQTALANFVAITRAAPTSHETLVAVARTNATQYSRQTSEIHMVPPPDPSFDGREVYSFAVQMPNIVSHSGSWLMWFAEREPLGPHRELQPPVPLHKVDPKYFQSAISDGVEGNVVLSGVLQTNGRIREIRILKGIDPRLDLSAARALLKWEFVAAQRLGIPVEMDMIAVIPFLLGTHAAP